MSWGSGLNNRPDLPDPGLQDPGLQDPRNPGQVTEIRQLTANQAKNTAIPRGPTFVCRRAGGIA